jgi:hypothetical protein
LNLSGLQVLSLPNLGKWGDRVLSNQPPENQYLAAIAPEI